MSSVGMIAGLVFLVALGGVTLPFTLGRRLLLQPPSSRADDAAVASLRSLRDLQRDRERGAVDDQEYELMRQALEQDAVTAVQGAQTRDSAKEKPKKRVRSVGRGLKERRRPARLGRAGGRRAFVGVAVVAALLVLAAVGVAAGGIASRTDGDLITGGVPSIQDTQTHQLELAVKANPNDLKARLALGQRYLELNRMGDALQQYLAVVKLDPGNAEASTRIALLIYEGGDNQTALATVDHVLVLHPAYPEALFLKGVILLNGLNRPADAVAPLEAYLAVDPNGGYAKDAGELLKKAQSR